MLNKTQSYLVNQHMSQLKLMLETFEKSQEIAEEQIRNSMIVGNEITLEGAGSNINLNS